MPTFTVAVPMWLHRSRPRLFVSKLRLHVCGNINLLICGGIPQKQGVPQGDLWLCALAAVLMELETATADFPAKVVVV